MKENLDQIKEADYFSGPQFHLPQKGKGAFTRKKHWPHAWMVASEWKTLMAVPTIQIVNQSFKSVAFAHKKSLVNAMHALQEFKVSRQMNEIERS